MITRTEKEEKLKELANRCALIIVCSTITRRFGANIDAMSLANEISSKVEKAILDYEKFLDANK